MTNSVYQDFKNYLEQCQFQVTVTVFSIMTAWALGFILPTVLLV